MHGHELMMTTGNGERPPRESQAFCHLRFRSTTLRMEASLDASALRCLLGQHMNVIYGAAWLPSGVGRSATHAAPLTTSAPAAKRTVGCVGRVTEKAKSGLSALRPKPSLAS